MYTTKRIVAATLAGAAMFVAPAVVCAAPALAATQNVMAVAAEHDAQQGLAHANHGAGINLAHAQQDVFRVSKTGQIQFHDDGGHTMSFDH